MFQHHKVFIFLYEAIMHKLSLAYSKCNPQSQCPESLSDFFQQVKDKEIDSDILGIHAAILLLICSDIRL